MVFLEINNAELKKEISHFMQRLDTTVEYKYVMWVKCNVIKDTISEYFIFPNPTFAFLDSEPFHFVCSVDERPVFFEVRSLSSIDCETPVFKIKREALMDLIKREFPKEYNDLMQLKENEVYLPFIPNEYPETLVLIFINGKLSNKKNGRGLLERSFDVQMDKVR
jgi:hypothetical protein